MYIICLYFIKFAKWTCYLHKQEKIEIKLEFLQEVFKPFISPDPYPKTQQNNNGFNFSFKNYSLKKSNWLKSKVEQIRGNSFFM
jgi:hypothetical protein